MAKRKIIKIDEEKCNGCGLCIPNCPEGALQIIDEKARLIGDFFCDGLGACIGHCPQGAITIEEREAEKYDEKKVMANIVKHSSNMIKAQYGFQGCPGSQALDFRASKKGASAKNKTALHQESSLRQWPVQIMLVPPNAPHFDKADLLIAADCVPFAYADFHKNFLEGKILLVGCPKLDDIAFYQKKISQIVKENDIKSVTCVRMEVPCCFGLVGMIQKAIADSGKKILFKEINISIRGENL
ncbi:MAG: 4Fe-4S binding protein [Candidatus Omnitrophota bacterium]